VIGVMGKGRSHVGLFPKLHGATLAALVDRNPDGAKLARECGVPFFPSVEALIKAGVVDAVFCVVPHSVRREVSVPCLEAGLHVLSEKPLAAKPSDAAAIVEAAGKNGCTLAVNYQYRQRPALRKAKALLDAGAVGNWYYATMHHGINRTQSYYDARSWRGTWVGEGGGVLVNQASHPLDAMMYLLGSFPKRVVAFNATLRHKIQTEDLFTAILQYDNGAQATVHADTIQLPISEWWSIHGDRGTLRVDEHQVTLNGIEPDLVSAIAGGDGSTKPAAVHCEREVFTPKEPDPKHVGMVQDFVDAVREGRPPLVSGAWGLQCVELHAAIIASALEGEAVEFPPDHGKYDQLLERLAAQKTTR
jgi:predicted dehydrogenase